MHYVGDWRTRGLVKPQLYGHYKLRPIIREPFGPPTQQETAVALLLAKLVAEIERKLFFGSSDDA